MYREVVDVHAHRARHSGQPQPVPTERAGLQILLPEVHRDRAVLVEEGSRLEQDALARSEAAAVWNSSLYISPPCRMFLSPFDLLELVRQGVRRPGPVATLRTRGQAAEDPSHATTRGGDGHRHRLVLRQRHVVLEKDRVAVT